MAGENLNAETNTLEKSLSNLPSSTLDPRKSRPLTRLGGGEESKRWKRGRVSLDLEAGLRPESK